MSAFLGGFAKSIGNSIGTMWQEERDEAAMKRKAELLEQIEINKEDRAAERERKKGSRVVMEPRADGVYEVSYNSEGGKVGERKLSETESKAHMETLRKPGLENAASEASAATSRAYGGAANAQALEAEARRRQMNLEYDTYYSQGLTPPWDQRAATTAGTLTDIQVNQAAQNAVKALTGSGLSPAERTQLASDIGTIQTRKDMTPEQKIAAINELTAGLGEDAGGPPTLKVK